MQGGVAKKTPGWKDDARENRFNKSQLVPVDLWPARYSVIVRGHREASQRDYFKAILWGADAHSITPVHGSDGGGRWTTSDALISSLPSLPLSLHDRLALFPHRRLVTFRAR
jgi:hypothetical protein